MIQATAQLELTPAMLAEAFWAMPSTLQVAFFDELAAIIKRDHQDGNTSAYSLGELQWHFVGEELQETKNAQARAMLMTMAAPVYMHTLMYCEAKS